MNDSKDMREALEAIRAKLGAKEARSPRLKAHQALSLPSKSLYYRWQSVLVKLENRLITLTEALADSLDGQGDKNLFDLISAVNSLLDLTDRLHQRAWVMKELTLAAFGRTPATNAKLELPEDLLLGTPPNTNK